MSIIDKLRFSIRLRLILTYTLHTLSIFIFFVIFVMVVFRSSFPSEIVQKYEDDLFRILSMGLGAVVFLSILAGNRSGKKLVEPIYRMNEQMKEISINNLSARIEVSGVKDELKDLAIAFNAMMDQIQNSVEKQNQFVSDASHELRTPISVVKGYADLLDRWGKSEEQVRDEAITAIQQEAEHMKQLIEKLLFLARGDMKVQKLEKEPFLISEVIEEIYRETKMIDESHQILLEQNEDNMIFADRGMIKEAVRIFVENSIKYTPIGGQIVLSTYQYNHKVEIIVKDTGEGIRREDLRRIFDRFYRADKSRSKQSGGTGLGLAIAKWIIDIHQGKIYAKSQIGRGSEFCIVLPLVDNSRLSKEVE